MNSYAILFNNNESPEVFVDADEFYLNSEYGEYRFFIDEELVALFPVGPSLIGIIKLDPEEPEEMVE